MQATHTDVFALKKSGLEVFLYADVGAEANGSTLTIFSILARLGKDPWAEAALWAALPKAAVIDSLAQSIAEMPLAASALAGARDSAARLVQLLPSDVRMARRGAAAQSAPATLKLAPLTILYVTFAVGMALNLLLIPGPPSSAPTPVTQPTATPVAADHAQSIVLGAVAVDPPVAPARR